MNCPHCEKPMRRIKMTKYETLYQCPICQYTELRRDKDNKLITELKEKDGN